MVFEQLATGILDFVNYGITVIVIMWVVEAGRFVFHGSSASGGQAWEWFKGKKQEYDQNKEKKQKEEKKKAKRAFHLEVGELASEQQELDLMKRALKHVEEVGIKKDHLQALPGTDPDAEHKFQAFTGEIKAVIDDELEPELRAWRNVKRNTFKAQRRLNDLIKQLEADQDVPPEKINELKAEERKILALHEQTEKEIEKLLDALNKMHEVATDAHGTIRMITPVTHGPYGAGGGLVFDVADAQRKLRAFDFKGVAIPLAQELVTLQGQGKPGAPGVMKLLEGIIIMTKRFV